MRREGRGEGKGGRGDKVEWGGEERNMESYKFRFQIMSAVGITHFFSLSRVK